MPFKKVSNLFRTTLIVLTSLVLFFSAVNLVSAEEPVSWGIIPTQPLSVIDKLLNYFGAGTIPISGANQLDSSRGIIADLFSQLSKQDDVWVNIPSGDYVRATFERELTNKNDITVYAKGAGSIEVYRKDSTEKIMDINIAGEKTYRKLLTNLQGPEIIFDLKIVGDIQLDYVTDPTCSATGGTITQVNGYCIHTFTSNGNFSLPGESTIDVLVVGGGASGGNRIGGGGGAGGAVYQQNKTIQGSTYPVTIGAGGAAVTGWGAGNNGQNSIFHDVTAFGGGGGGVYAGHQNGFDGGCGGGTTAAGWIAGLTPGVGSQGYNGATRINGNEQGGGGGMGSAGVGRNGGDGLTYSISGSSVYYAGGGGGGDGVGGTGGLGGGGAGVPAHNSPAGSGTPNTGSGGGGTRDDNDSNATVSGAGGSGVVIVSYSPENIGMSASVSTVTLSSTTNISTSTATLNGNITVTGGEDPTVTMYWGLTDGGQVAVNWEHNSSLGVKSVTSFLENITNLTPGTQYYFSAKASNSGGDSWPGSSSFFYTNPLNCPATGGTITTVDGSCIHTFNSSGSFSISANISNAKVLVVGGGGSGYPGAYGGAGGAGGLIYSSNYSISSGSKTIVVGNGGVGTVGGNSSFDGVTAYGGGVANSGNGGSGSGGGYSSNAKGYSTQNSPAGFTGYGNNGGNGTNGTGRGGGGGGAGGVGGDASGDNAGNGGAGLNISISGSSVCYAGGGGGGVISYGTPGTATCGGGDGKLRGYNGEDGTANTGGGGGGGGDSNYGGAGGSGVVIVSYLAADYVGPPTITLNSATNVSISTATISGNVTDTGGDNPTVTLYWGTTDGGQTPGNWDHNSIITNPAQPQGIAAFTKNISGLISGVTYYFSASATNSVGTSWPVASLNFTTDFSCAATGGIVTIANGKCVHTFNSSGTFTITNAITGAESLIVAGGGGGASGGGGAGGIIYNNSLSLSTGTYNVVVGNGGAGGIAGQYNDGSNGQDSIFNSLTAIGGGGGSNWGESGLSGGSGGGAGNRGSGSGGAGTADQGYRGGNGGGGSEPCLGAGGGGAGGIGHDDDCSGTGNVGGIGILNPINGSTLGELSVGNYYLGGGGGGGGRGGYSGGAGGLGGGGQGTSGGTAGAGLTNSGAGGGAAGWNGEYGTGGAGGSGVVIISYTPTVIPPAAAFILKAGTIIRGMFIVR
ncbi:MAG: fibronectin type III domain-containing protein [Minisyncoccia bacterium]